MADERANKLVSRYKAMKMERSNFETYWESTAKLVFPNASDFNTKRSPGERRDHYLFDSTGSSSLHMFGAALQSQLTPPTMKWHGLLPIEDDEALNTDDEVLAYLDAVTSRLFRRRYAPNSAFSINAHEGYISLGAFGNQCMLVEDGLARGPIYRHIPLAQVFIAENAEGMVDTVFRLYEYTARQAFQRWGMALDERIRKVLDTEPDKKFEFLHCVMPADDTWATGSSSMRVYAADVDVSHSRIIGEGGYRVMPYLFSRYTRAPGELYGRGPSMDSLPNMRTLNEMVKTMLRYGQRSVDPTILTADLDSLSPFSLRSGAVNAGYLTEQGTPLAATLPLTGDPRANLEMQEYYRKQIARDHLVTFFQLMVETPQMTATEVMHRQQEKGALLAPTVGRQESEFLGPLIRREVDILTAMGDLPPMPQKLADKGGNVRIEFQSPLSRAQKAEQGIGILRTLEAIAPIVQNAPDLLNDIFNIDEMIRVLVEVNGAPRRVVRPRDETARIREEREVSSQMQQMLQAAPIAADAAKTLAETQAIAGRSVI